MKKISHAKLCTLLTLISSPCLMLTENKNLSTFEKVKAEISSEAHDIVKEIQNAYNKVDEWSDESKKNNHSLQAAHGTIELHQKTADKANDLLKTPETSAYKKTANKAQKTVERAQKKTEKLSQKLHQHLKENAEKVKQLHAETVKAHDEVHASLASKKHPKKEKKQKKTNIKK